MYINEGELIVSNIASDSRSYNFFPEQSHKWLTKALENGLRSVLGGKGRAKYKEIVKYWEHKKTFAQYLRTWADLGIFHIQFNVVTREDLLDAQAHPEKYTDLVSQGSEL